MHKSIRILPLASTFLARLLFCSTTWQSQYNKRDFQEILFHLSSSVWMGNLEIQPENNTHYFKIINLATCMETNLLQSWRDQTTRTAATLNRKRGQKDLLLIRYHSYRCLVQLYTGNDDNSNEQNIAALTLAMITTPTSEILQLYTGNDYNSNERNIAALHWQWLQLQRVKYWSFTLTMMTTPMSEIFSNRT